MLGTTSRPRSKWRPLPLDTVVCIHLRIVIWLQGQRSDCTRRIQELEKLVSRKLKISAKETMGIAEKLYTQGLISYPRTETNIFPDSFDLCEVIEQQTGDPQWGNFALWAIDFRP